MNSTDIENLCRRIAPGDFGSHPIYICFGSELPEPLKPAASIWGYTGELLDLVLHTWLAESELRKSTPDEFDDRREERERNVRQTDSEFRAAQKHLAEVESRLNSAQLEVPVDDEQVALYRQQVQNAKSRLQASQEAATQAVEQQNELLKEMAAA